ncbi:MAG: lipopolysaccharide export system ATP-binding protein [Cycloclasticus pugetii]|jgi:lipopolysaccharide export system ATP-binding protein|uniref:Lipopolysaccharide export system ATP-binding protein LptB n=2 Tax=Cycloclasticus TaxID=34067 RepID=S5T5Q5_9GAMM|nr:MULTISPECIES: LPS export ABC transporter ATP-binding protein [Cycloclasticus]AFT67679.1 ABC-type transport system, ATPase component [Cycloclasticus sp. P1]AGS39151.1 ABC transporter, ATP-binding protein [Cycloclasticus zancles 78-ME]ATI02777.1 LPS export ABC transporter ATP-binding protein [Cycloclasticus sp. PY97N]EPD13521.1 ABC transporter ATPase [Cycloclasticus pugetii]MBV1897734.1 LPS export ABC transporter ATP-binding protein [Cycloclasticus sp.]|tara:strand:+ start:2745 stop:3470 length:726 start_codon:yes stop_codon:yes gene_type:complete
MSTLKTHNICKQFNNRKVVDNVSINVKSGEVVGLLGPNGAGKTTSFYITVGLIKPDSGDVFLDDENITQSPMHVRARQGLGYLPQEASIFRKLSVEDNIRAVLQTRKTLSPGQQELVLDELLNEFAIDQLRTQNALALSGGERRRLEIARALATEPRFVLLDEPFAGVDPISVIDIQKIIHHLTERDIGVLITDHNVRETLGTCDRAYILNNGRVITEGSAEDILEHREVRDVYLGHEFRM